MQVTELENKGLKRQYKIIIAADKVGEQMDVELKVAGERIKIPGFRPGFIPMKILRQRYSASVQPEVLKRLINQHTGELLAEKKIRPAMTPHIAIDEYKPNSDLVFTVAFDVFPEVPEVAFEKITLERKTYDIGDNDLDEAMARIAETSPKLVRMDAGSKAALGNALTIDFKGMIGGSLFEGGSASDFRLELGSGQFIEGFEDQLVGAKEGDERKVVVTFPKDYPAKNLAGKEATFDTKVKEIYRKDLPEVDDSFAQDRGFGDLKAFREAVKGQMVKEYDMLVRNDLKKQLFDALEKKYDFDLPPSMVDAEFGNIWDRLKEARMRGAEPDEGKSDAELQDEYKKIAQRRVKLGLALAEIGGKNKIQISRDELTRAIVQQATQYPGQEQKVMEFYRNNPERAEELRGPILEEKAVDLILGKVQYTDKKVPLKTLAGDDEDENSDSDAKKSAKKSTKGKDKEESSTKAKKKA